MPNTFTHMNQPHASYQRYCILRGVILQVALEQVISGDNYDRNPKIYLQITESRLEGTLRITWSNLSRPKYSLRKMTQHLVQLNLKKCPVLGNPPPPWGDYSDG